MDGPLADGSEPAGWSGDEDERLGCQSQLGRVAARWWTAGHGVVHTGRVREPLLHGRFDLGLLAATTILKKQAWIL